MSSRRDAEKRLESLQSENEVLDLELTREQKRASIREAKRQYGRDWKKMLGGAFQKIKVNAETLQDLHSMGVDNSDLRDLSRPGRPNRRY